MIGQIRAVNMLFGCNHTVTANACEILEIMSQFFLILHTVGEQCVT